MWRDFIAARAALAGEIRPLLIHPREWLDTRIRKPRKLQQYLAVAGELYKALQQNYRAVWDQSREWAQATLDAILSLNLVKVAASGAARIALARKRLCCRFTRCICGATGGSAKSCVICRRPDRFRIAIGG